MSTLNVLSIDIDYFQKVDIDTITRCYPDGLDLPSYITEVTWASHYMTDKQKLLNVSFDEDKFNELIDIILNQNDRSISIMITQSHKHIYKFIMDNFNNDCYDKCNIINIDMHHDCFNDNELLDCGNWIKHIKNSISDCSVNWIANAISDRVYGLQDLPIEKDFKNIHNIKFDLIFLCRSDSWFPPHLDIHFDKLYKILCKNFDNVLIDKQITHPRDINSILQNADKIKDII